MTWTGGSVSERATCVLAGNPGLLTLEGTNTWVLAEPAASRVVVVDPGPLDEIHLKAVLSTAQAGGRRVGLTLLTHGHADHAAGARRFAELSGAPVYALDPAHRVGSTEQRGDEQARSGDPTSKRSGRASAQRLMARLPAAGPPAERARRGARPVAEWSGERAAPHGSPSGRGPARGAREEPSATMGGAGDDLGDGGVLILDGLELRVVAAPGHSADSLCFFLVAEAAVLTGDTVLGRGTSVVAHPDGRLADYLASLHRLRELAPRWLLPGHGPARPDAPAVLDGYIAHRLERLAQVEAALAVGDRTAAQVVRRVYAGVDPMLWPAAELSVQAQLAYLAERDQH